VLPEECPGSVTSRHNGCRVGETRQNGSHRCQEADGRLFGGGNRHERLDNQLEVEMSERRESLFTAPVFLGMAFFVFGIAIVEKGLNLIGLSIPFTTVFPSQLLQWAATLLVFDIALVLRQMLENKL
jgi:hypothetical protein